MAESESALTIVEDNNTQLAPAELLGASPGARLEQAKQVSNLLAPVIKERNLTVNIQGNEYVLFEGWTLLGSMLGVFPSTESLTELFTADQNDSRIIGFEAKVVAKTLGGQVVGTAIARCTRSERTWAGRDEFALSSMAQTRAGAKALRMPLGFVMQLAGYSPTPADEMVYAGRAEEELYTSTPPPVPVPAPRPAAPAPAPSAPRINSHPPRTISEKQGKRLYAIQMGAADRVGVSKQEMQVFVSRELASHGCEVVESLTREPYDAICDKLEALTVEQFTNEDEGARFNAADAEEVPF